MELYYDFGEKEVYYEVEDDEAIERVIKEYFATKEDYFNNVELVLKLFKSETLKLWADNEIPYNDNDSKETNIRNFAAHYLREYLTPKKSIETMLYELDIEKEFIEVFKDEIKNMYYEEALYY